MGAVEILAFLSSSMQELEDEAIEAWLTDYSPCAKITVRVFFKLPK